jgi:hypothetical protein
MQPMIEVQGYCPETLASLSYDLSNASGLFSNQQAIVLNQDYSTNTWEFTTNTFQAFDVPLTNGANVLTFHAADLAGNVTTTNFTYVLSYAARTNPPIVQFYWPQNGTQISGNRFTVRGLLDDFNTTIQATIVDTNGDTNSVSAIVERDGDFWIENLPLAAGSNLLTLAATDVANNVTTTNITVMGSSLALSMYEIGLLWQSNGYAAGFISEPADYGVWVNGVEVNASGGYWESNVPFTPGSTAVFQVRAIPNSDNGGNGSGGGGSPSYANMGNPNSANAIDLEVTQDKPERMYLTNYGCTIAQSSHNYSQTIYDLAIGLLTNVDDQMTIGPYTFHWSDGVGGSDNWSETNIDNGSTTTCSQQDDWPASYWPSLVIGTGYSSCYPYPFEITYPPVTLEYCDVNLPTNSDYSYDWDGYNEAGAFSAVSSGWVKDTFIRQAQATILLDTGGKSVPGAQTIFGITCPMSDVMSTNPILPQNISIGGLGNLPSSGQLYVSLPNGTTVPTTPQTPGRQWDTFNPNATPIPVTLTANGYNLSQTNPTFCVGQQITFSVNCPGLPMTNVYCAWTLNGDYVNVSTNNSAGCEMNSINSNLLSGFNTSCQCWYYNGTSGTVGVQVNVIINGKILHSQAQGQFAIYRPSLTNFTDIDTPIVSVTMYPGGMYTGEILRVGDTNGNGIAYNVFLMTTIGGNAGITQIYDDQSYPTISNGSNVLDLAEFYPSNTTHTIYSGWVRNALSLNDTPWEASGFSGVTVGLILQFWDYVRFQPVGANSIYVTLGKVTWNVNASATNGSGGWATNSAGSLTLPSLNQTDEWPFWTR